MTKITIRLRLALFLVLFGHVTSASLSATEAPSPEPVNTEESAAEPKPEPKPEPKLSPVSFTRDIAPILADKCLACHKQDRAKGGYRVDTFQALLQPGDSEETPILPGKPDAGLFFHRLITDDEDERMPQQDDPLPSRQITLFKRWIQDGAKFDGRDVNQSLVSLLPKPKPAAPAKYPQPLPITALAWLQDGKTLAVSGYREVTLWNTEDGTLTRRISGMPERVFALSLHPDGKLLAVAGGSPGRNGSVVLVDVTSGKTVRELPLNNDTQLAVAFSPNGEFLAYAGAHNVIQVYSTKEWKPLWKVEAHADWVVQLAFSADSKMLASASRDRTAKVFHAGNGEVASTQTGHGNPVTSITFAAENHRFFSSANNGEVRLSEFKPEGETSSSVITGRRVEATRILFSAPYIFIASVDGRLRGFNSTKKKDDAPLELPHYDKQRIDAIALKPGSSILAIAGTSGKVRLIDLKEKKSILTFTASPGWETPVPKPAQVQPSPHSESKPQSPPAASSETRVGNTGSGSSATKTEVSGAAPE